MLHMTEREIVESYQRAKNQNAQIGIMAELNCCEKSEIENVLEKNGIIIKKRGRKPKEKAISKNENVAAAQTVIPEIVRAAVTEKMVAVQEKIDIQKEKIKRQEEIIEKEHSNLNDMEQELKTLNDFIKCAAG